MLAGHIGKEPSDLIDEFVSSPSLALKAYAEMLAKAIVKA